MTKARVNADNASADIQGVTAGTGLTGGGTSGTVTLTNDMATAIDAKGDLVVGTGADTYDNLAVGNNGETLVADSSASTGLRWQGNFAAGKNCVINGDFRINQRNVTSTTSNTDYVFDRFRLGRGGGGTVTFSSQAFTAGTAPVAGYEAVNFARLVTVSQSANADYAAIRYAAEDVRTYAGSTITLSVWAKGASGGEKFNFALEQVFGSGGSSAVITKTAVQTITNTWARYSVTVAVPSISGKTIGTGSALMIWLFTSGGSSLSSYTDIGNQNATVDFWGLQAEIGNTATAFQTATGTLAGELAACRRYLPAVMVGAGNSLNGYATASGNSYVVAHFDTVARVQPTGISVPTLTGNFTLYAGGGGSGTPTALAFDSAGVNSGMIQVTTGAGSPTLAANNAVALRSTSTASYILFTGCEL